MTDRHNIPGETEPMRKQNYSPEEANAILNSAVREKPLPGDITRQHLEEMAAEMGITPEELSAAERRCVAEREEEELRQAFRADRRWRLSLLAIVSVFCVATSALSGDARPSAVAVLALTFLMIFLVGLARMTLGGEDVAFHRWLYRRNRRMLFGPGPLPRRLRRY